MRPQMLIGVLLIALGGFLFYNGGSFTTQKKLVEIGDLKVTAPEEHALPKWAGAVAVLAGLGLVVVGAQSQRRA